MPDINEIRRQNLQLLIDEAGSQVALGLKTLTSNSYISQIMNSRPTTKGTPRGMGDDVARRMEKMMDKPDGWMDEVHPIVHMVAEPKAKFEAHRHYSELAVYTALLEMETFLQEHQFETEPDKNASLLIYLLREVSKETDVREAVRSKLQFYLLGASTS